ncbi:MAG: transcriptional regulator, LuxR family [Propionibacteriaceae bacterium]|jgi:DNA-binding NarL/FixJ family response regulator|nr:transcriptional regulator, LuxR family [Propionibacteriaceae bacterium]MDF3016316.1 transcriptional regulator, LuxR family [Thermomicrobiales bacterium]
MRAVRGRLWRPARSSAGTKIKLQSPIEPASGDHLISLLFAAYGLTAREREICRKVIAGHSTGDIAERLFISSNTVQDHLNQCSAR